ncbi:MAG TPA: sigma-70 family RNA polymerase sigma factor [Thermomicrobiales bacterium]|jgi:RNA polymerase sigma factor (sigma-70 family)|nr:sigma-70 family RNA polymerase sigma factor [Thermomicrobiales bacterium]
MASGEDRTARDADAALLAACLAGDQAAWDTLVNRYTRLILSIARRSGLNDEDAADVVQNVFTTVLRRLEALQQPERFSSWLITTTHRESWRVARLRLPVGGDDMPESVDHDPLSEEQVIALERATVVRRGLDLLDARCRRLITSLFLVPDRPSYEDVSADLGIAIGSIGPIRARCLKRLRGHMLDLGLTDPAG